MLKVRTPPSGQILRFIIMKDSGLKPSASDAAFHLSNVEKLVGTRRITLADLKNKSPITIPNDPTEQFLLALAKLYDPGDFIELIAGVKAGGQQKAAPMGNKLRYTASQLGELSKVDFYDALLGSGRCGTYMRINPIEGTRSGSGMNGCTTDADVFAHRFCLVEHDHLPKETQATLLAGLPLPIAAIVDSGGQSLHAWVKIGATSGGPFAEEVRRLYKFLGLLGFDTSNTNPSRLTRAPGFARLEEPDNPQKQSLLYLNPLPANAPILSSHQ